jgi:hypothetical protein
MSASFFGELQRFSQIRKLVSKMLRNITKVKERIVVYLQKKEQCLHQLCIKEQLWSAQGTCLLFADLVEQSSIFA